jgi:uncharacterized protein
MSDHGRVPGQIDLSGPVDLDALDAFLASDRSPDDCMQLSELDGFLTGVVVSPEPIMPSEWLVEIWGEEDDPDFSDMDEAQTVLGLIMRRYNQISQTLERGPDAFSPVFWEDADGEPDPIDWVNGFVHAMALRASAWQPLASDPEAGVLLMPIVLISSMGEEGPDLDMEALPPEEMEKLVSGVDAIIPGCVAGIRAYWRERSGGLPPRPGSRGGGRRRR